MLTSNQRLRAFVSEFILYTLLLNINFKVCRGVSNESYRLLLPHSNCMAGKISVNIPENTLPPKLLWFRFAHYSYSFASLYYIQDYNSTRWSVCLRSHF